MTSERDPEPVQHESTGPNTDPDVHIDPDQPQGVDEDALETESLGEGGPSGA